MCEVVEERELHDPPRVGFESLDLLGDQQRLPQIDLGRDEIVGAGDALQLFMQQADARAGLVRVRDAPDRKSVA
jgi:hypothetical protein